MTTLKVPFPKLEGLEIKNATVDIENGVSVVEYGAKEPKFKKGDIVVSRHFILPFMGVSKNEAILFNCFYSIANRYAAVKAKVIVGCGYISEYRLATPSEQQLLFDALAKEGKKWNAETLQLEDIQKDILVPESIGIYRSRDDFELDGDELYIAFNNNTQLLYYESYHNTWCVRPLHSGYEKVQCKLVPCKREDLQAGDTVFVTDNILPDFKKACGYSKILSASKRVRAEWIAEYSEVRVCHIVYTYYYKVVPIDCK